MFPDVRKPGVFILKGNFTQVDQELNNYYNLGQIYTFTLEKLKNDG
jgi:hypothetical protein